MNQWKYQEQLFTLPEKNPYEGFVYLIENTVLNKYYIGMKSFWSKRLNKQTNRRNRIESDWQNYYGSSDVIKNDVKLYGKENFKRTILHLCYYKKQMSFLEQKEQWKHNVLFDDNYYNTNIGGKFFKSELYIYTATEKKSRKRTAT